MDDDDRADENMRQADFPPGFYQEDPYSGEDISTYPEWWSRNIRKFREYNMRPYRPPRFSDGVFVPEIIKDLESDLEVSITLMSKNPKTGSSWNIIVDGELIASIDRDRVGENFSVYDISSKQFESLIRNINKKRQ